MEKYLNDTISKTSQAEYEVYCATNKMPKHLKRLQYKEDSIRARKWFDMTKDSSYIMKYISSAPVIKEPVRNDEVPQAPSSRWPEPLAFLPEKLYYLHRNNSFITA
jgi:penicillin-binding protein 2